LRVLFAGTMPTQTNGYAKVVYNIAKHIGGYDDIKLTIYGFQNYKQHTSETNRNEIPPSVTLHDALATEQPARHGFGEKEIATYLRSHPQDVVVIFNDAVITSALTQTILEQMTPEERKGFKLVSYKDMVYPYDRQSYVQLLNQNFDAIVAFTPYWRQTARELGVRADMPYYVFPHGFDHERYFPVPRQLARAYFNLPQDAFIVLNLNRNQPRKRWDHTIMAMADVVRRHLDYEKAQGAKKKDAVRPIKLLVATQMDGFWNLAEIFDHQLRMRGLSFEGEGRNYLLSMAKPQGMTDHEINVLYSACDVGLNTCEGEGFGLCQFEHAAVGAPQVAPNIGGFREFLHAQNSILVEPKHFCYVDKSRDNVGGYAECSDPIDVADAIWKYYLNPTLVAKHGRRARRDILQHYRWETVCAHFHKVLRHIGGR
jgi:glycosyltransferase involved in cell wall biosynthesis